MGEFKPLEHVETRRKFTLRLDAEGLRRLLLQVGMDVPQDVAIYVMCPGGGDWSNMEIDIKDSPVIVAWETVERS